MGGILQEWEEFSLTDCDSDTRSPIWRNFVLQA